MAIVYTDDTIITASAALTSRAVGLDFLDDTLRAAGLTATAITNGFRYIMESPQGLRARLEVWDPLAGSDVYMQMSSYDGLIVPASFRRMRCNGATVTAIAERSQLWTLKAGQASDLTGACYNFGAGVPYVFDPACTEAWWCSGPGFRAGHRQVNTDYYHSACCWNGVLLENDFWNQLNQSLQLVLVELPYGVNEVPPVCRFHDDSPLYYEPMISWGSAGVTGVFRAQLPNAVFRSVPGTLDDTLTVGGDSLYVYSAETGHGSLCLLTGGGSGGGESHAY